MFAIATTGAAAAARQLAAAAAFCAVIAAVPASAEPAANAPAAEAAAPTSFAPLVRRVAPAVVNISSTMKKNASAAGGQFGRVSSEKARTALGSGFIIDPAGYVVTNNHVIENATAIKVVMNDGADYPAKLIGVDTKTDLALLKIDVGHALPAVAFGNSDEASIGDWVVAVGNPFGLGGTVTAGIISGRERDLNRGPYDDFLQIDAPLNRGNSGGPLFNVRGEVIGINSAIASPNGGSVGIGFAIPASLAQPAIAELKASGKVVRGWLGITLQKVTPEIAEGLGLGKPRGAMVSAVTPDAPAAKAGIQQGDVVVRYDGKPVESQHDLPLMIAETRVGSTVDVVIWRQGHEVALQVTMARLEAAAAETDRGEDDAAASSVEAYGLALATLDSDTRKQFGVAEAMRGVVISGKRDAVSEGLQPGDVIRKVDGEAALMPAQVKQQLEHLAHSGRKTVLFLLNRQGNDLIVGFRLANG
jgi:serine protease Do